MSLQQLEFMAQHSPPESVYILGVRVDRLSQQQALDSIEQIIARRRASDNQTPCQQVITVNPEFVMAAQHNLDFRIAINQAALVLPDGIGVVWLHTLWGNLCLSVSPARIHCQRWLNVVRRQ